MEQDITLMNQASYITLILLITSGVCFIVCVSIGMLTEHYTNKHNYVMFKLAGLTGFITVALFTLFMTLQN